ncbi:hypothetical protein DPM19_32215 [Actinomadura craniellae]|uniref:RDD domain-containing protein n=1 Tax=Actinomadura craniellae TaxID=2231787 RepID=A0A365GWH7_9ACTN|nr:RDD family protein [Actinomadura craniellae]RAY11169.1 hypothetical protein DPM19_32215 [Actinomadura craniellae]
MYGPPPPVPPPVPPPGRSDAAPLFRRALAWAVDFGLMLAVAFGLGTAVYSVIIFVVERGAAQYTVRTGMWAVVRSGGELGAGTEQLTRAWDTTVLLITLAFAVLVAIQFLYQFTALVWRGRTLGKALADVRVGAPGGTRPTAGRAVRRAAVTTLTDTALISLAFVLLLHGEPVVAVLCWLLAVAAFWANALPVLAGGRRSLGDRAAGTAAVRARTYEAAGRAVLHGARQAVGGAQSGALHLAEHERVRQARELGRQTAERLRQAPDLGGQVRRALPADSARQAGRRLGRRLRPDRSPPAPPLPPGPAQPGPPQD